MILNKRRIKDLTGRQFFRLKVVSFSHLNEGRKAIWNCLCVCGKETKVRGNSLSRGLTRSCGCYHKDKTIGYTPSNKLSRSEAMCRALYSSYTRTSAKRRIMFDLTYLDFVFLTSQNCYYCGLPPSQKRHSKETNGYYLYNGIDRIDSNDGYLIENCVACCKTCNYAKRVMSKYDFSNWIARVSVHWAEKYKEQEEIYDSISRS